MRRASCDSVKEDEIPFNSVIRSARWRALKGMRFSVGQLSRGKAMRAKEGRT